jgi:hypothetical protein
MIDRVRHPLAIALAVAGLIMILASTIVLFVRENVWDRDGFATNVVEAFRDDAVATYASSAIVEQVVLGVNEDLIAGQAAIEQILPTVLESDAARPIIYVAAQEVHDTLFAPNTQTHLLNLADIGSIVGAYLRFRGVEQANAVPTDLNAAVLTIAETPEVETLVSLAGTANTLSYVLPPAALVLLALAIVAARNRRQAVIAIGIGIALSGLLFWIGVEIFESSTLSELDDEVRDAAAGTMKAFVGVAATWAIVLGAAGALIAASAASAFSVEEINSRVRHAWRLGASAPKHEWLRALRGLLLVALGVFVVFKRDLALAIALSAVAFYLVLVGLSELVRQVERYSTRSAGPEPRTRRILPWAVGALGIGGAITALVILLSSSPSPEEAVAATDVDECNGHVELCDRPFDEVAFASVHNAMSAASQGFSNPNQQAGLIDQLDAGYRAFLIDAYLGAPGTRGPIITDLTDYNRDPIVAVIGEEGLAAAERLAGAPIEPGTSPPGPKTVYLCHVLCELGASEMVEVMSDVRGWLDQHPSEVLVFFIEDRGPSFEQLEDVFAESGLLDQIFIAPSPGQPWPTLRELIDSGQRILVMAENGGEPGTWYQNGFTLTQETPYDTPTIAGLESDESCEPNRGGTSGDLFLLNHWVAVYPPKPSDARVVNARDLLLDRARRCQELRGKLPNLVAVDFWDRGDVVAVIDELNGVSEGISPSDTGAS